MYHIQQLCGLYCHQICVNVFMWYFVTGAVGISSLQFLNMNLQRNIFIIGFSLFMGFSVPQYFTEYMMSSGHGPSHSRGHWVCQ